MGQAGGPTLDATTHRFLGLCGAPSRLRRWLSALVPGPDAPERLSRIVDCNDLVVYASPETPFALMSADSGVAFGEMVDRTSRPGRSGAPESDEAVHISIFIERTRLDPPPGDYAAFLRFDGQVIVLRGPGGLVAVHYLETAEVAAFFSHIELGRQLGLGEGNSHAPGCRRQQPFAAGQSPRELEPGGIYYVGGRRGMPLDS